MSEEIQSTAASTFMDASDHIVDWMTEIDRQEDEALDKIFTRFCLLKGKEINFNDVKRKRYSDNPNFWDYYYKPGTPEQYFLMSRELIINKLDVRVEPTLRITFSGELLKEN